MTLSKSMTQERQLSQALSELQISSSTELNTATAASSYALTDLGTLGGRLTVAKDINDSAQIVGYSITSNGQRRSFIWHPEKGIENIGTVGNNSNCAYGINDYGQVVGYFVSDSGQHKAFIWDETKGIQDINTKSNNFSEAYSINNLGQVVGHTIDSNGQRKAFIWDEKNGMQNIDFCGEIESSAYSINDSGEVVGYSVCSNLIVKAFIWKREKGIQELPGFLASDINIHGQVVGFNAVPEDNNRAFLLNESNTFQDLTTLSGDLDLQFFDSEANSINNSGLIVGYSDKLVNIETGVWEKRAFIWDNFNQMQDLNNLIFPNDNLILREALGINNHGQIVGWGNKGKSRHAFLLTPTL